MGSLSLRVRSMVLVFLLFGLNIKNRIQACGMCKTLEIIHGAQR